MCGKLTAYGSSAVTLPFLDGLKLWGRVRSDAGQAREGAATGALRAEMARGCGDGSSTRGMGSHKEAIYLAVAVIYSAATLTADHPVDAVAGARQAKWRRWPGWLQRRSESCEAAEA
jgi:hypothetical protein